MPSHIARQFGRAHVAMLTVAVRTPAQRTFLLAVPRQAQPPRHHLRDRAAFGEACAPLPVPDGQAVHFGRRTATRMVTSTAFHHGKPSPFVTMPVAIAINSAPASFVGSFKQLALLGGLLKWKIAKQNHMNQGPTSKS